MVIILLIMVINLLKMVINLLNMVIDLVIRWWLTIDQNLNGFPSGKPMVSI